MAAFGVRVAGMPVSALDGLRCRTATGHADDIVVLEAALHREGAALADALFHVIGDPTARECKGRLVALRRAIFNGRRPPAAALDDRTLATLGPELAVRVRDWAARREQREALAAALRPKLEADVRAAAHALRDAVSAPSMQLSLLYTGAEILADAQRWLTRPDRRGTGRTAVRLAKYVSRAAAKTSPLSLFTASGLGEWQAGGPLLELADPQPCSVVDINLLVLYQLMITLAGRPALADRMGVRVNPAVARDGELVRFVVPGLAGTVRSLRRTRALDALMQGLDDGLVLADLRAALTSTRPDGDQHRRVAEFVDRLLRIGLLELHLPVADQALDARSMLRWLDATRNGDAGLEDVRRNLAALAESLDGYAAAETLPARARHRTRIETAVAQLPPLGGASGAPVWSNSLPVFFENAVLPGRAVVADRERWRPVLDDLRLVAELSRLYDPGLPARLALFAYVAERYGEGARIPLLRFFAAYDEEQRAGGYPDMRIGPGDLDPMRALWRSFADPAGSLTRSLQASPLPQLQLLGDLRREIAAQVRGGGGNPERAEMDRDRIRSWLARAAPLALPRDGSVGCYVQPYLAGAEPRFVLNGVRVGMGSGRTRIRTLMRRAFGEAAVGREPIARSAPGKPLLVEIESGFASALNQRDPAVDRVLAYPSTVSARPESARVAPGDLVVVHDPSLGCVRLDRIQDRREVVPVHLGLFALPLLPPIVQFLVHVFGRSPTVFVPSMLAWDSVRGRDGGDDVQAWPRVQMGAVTLRRRGWWIPAHRVPRRAATEDDAARLLAVTRWRHELGLPERCFVRVLQEPPDEAPEPPVPGRWPGDGRLASWMGKSRKPMYIDFASWHLIQVFDRMVAGTGANLVVEEALPDLADAPRTPSGERRVVELIVETPLSDLGGEPSAAV
jgi:hypothetical protein